jgi:hypothetical protein
VAAAGASSAESAERILDLNHSELLTRAREHLNLSAGLIEAQASIIDETEYFDQDMADRVDGPADAELVPTRNRSLAAEIDAFIASTADTADGTGKETGMETTK